MTSGSLAGQTLGKYHVLAPLGAGGMARVYRAHHPQLDRQVAIKVLRSDLVADPEFLARFQREARAVAALRHPNIVQVFDFDVQGDVYYMVMELLEGDSLKARLHHYRAAGATMEPGEAGRILVDALAGLGYAHGEGLIHRDLKAANLMLTRRGQAVLTDFGIAQLAGGGRQTASGVLLGTLNYMAPEQGLNGQCDARSDLYALGVVLFEMLTGRVPFDADTPLAILLKHANEPLPLPRSLNPAIPEPLELVLLKVLSKQPDDRYASAAAFSSDLQAALQAAGVPLPERVAPLPSELASAPPAVVLSGSARASVAGLPLLDDQTDTSLGAPRPVAVPAAPAGRLRRAAAIMLWSVLAVHLISLALAGALAVVGRFASAAWPAELLLVAFCLSLLLEAAGRPWLFVPLAVVVNVGLLLAYYSASQQWQRWYWWPLLVLGLAIEITLAQRWMAGDRRRARWLGAALSLLTGTLVVLQLALALVLAAR